MATHHSDQDVQEAAAEEPHLLHTLGFGWHFQTFKGHNNFQLLQSKFPPTSHPYAPHLYASSVPNICAPIHNLSNQGILPETICSLSVCFTKKITKSVSQRDILAYFRTKALNHAVTQSFYFFGFCYLPYPPNRKKSTTKAPSG